MTLSHVVTSRVSSEPPLPRFETVNPFAATANAHAIRDALSVADDAPAGSYTYSLVKSAPDVRPDEVELADVDTIEVMILWGTTALSVAHLNPPRSYYVGEEQHANARSDFLLPADRLGTGRMPVVQSENGRSFIVIPAAARGYFEAPGRPRVTLDEARLSAEPCAELGGAGRLELSRGTKARIELDSGFVFQVAAVAAGKPTPRALTSVVDRAFGACFGLSLFASAGLIAAAAFFVPPLGLTEDGMTDEDRLYAIQQYNNALAERERERQEDLTAPEAQRSDEGGTGTRAKFEEGQMGNPTTRATGKRWTAKGPEDNQDIQLARLKAIAEARDFGLIGLLHSGAAGDPNAPTVPWGGEDTLGRDAESHTGNMWGDPGDSFGFGGLGLTGIGEGGGGRGEGIGLGNVGTYSHGAGLYPGEGFGRHAGRLMKGHKTTGPRMRAGVTTVDNGRLPPEVIQRIVRQNFGRFRMCYEQGLAKNPNLEGRVAARFVIDRTGAVSNAGNGGSDLPDSAVVSCVVSAFYGLSFPTPDGGIVSVVYPISFSPG